MLYLPIPVLHKMTDITEAVDIGLCPDLCCFSCKSLLSISPILLDAEGKNLCGRCIKDLKERAFVRNIYYESLAVQFSFPCRYFNEGCYVKMRFNEIKLHEENCPYKVIKCPITACTWSGIITELIIHFGLRHQELKLSNDEAKELSSLDGCFMLNTNNFHFVVTWLCSETSVTIEVQNVEFIDSNADLKITCSLVTADSTNPLKIVQHLKLKTSFIIEIHNFQKIFSMNVELPENIIKEKLEQLNKIKCPCCHLQMAPPILKCPKDHITCLDCTRADYDFCSQCVEDELHFTRMRELDLITVSSLYTCKWQGCEDYFSFKHIRAHEQSCSKRTFMCMHCFQWYGFFSDISCHDALCRSKKSVCPLITGTEITILGTSTGMGEYLLLAFKEVFWIICKSTENGTNISVSNYGPVSCLDWYYYEADLQHMEDPNSPFNKTFSINNKSYNEFTVDVPINDTAKFGESKFYKIIVRIILLNDDERSKNMTVNFRRFN